MKYLTQQITEYLSTNLVDTEAEWLVGTTYSVGDTVKYGNYYYKSVVDSNLGYNPEDYNDLKWFKYAVSNKYAMLDLSASSKSSYTGNMEVVFTQDNKDTITIGNYTAANVLVEILDLVTDHNLATNSGFDTDTDWTKGTGWTIGSGTASSDGTQAADSELSQAYTFLDGVKYMVQVDVTAISAGTLKLFYNDGVQLESASVTTIGTSFFTFIGDGTSNLFGVVADVDFVGTIDNLYVAPYNDYVLWSYETYDTLNQNVIDYWTYMYEGYGYELDKGIMISLPVYGENIRVTFNDPGGIGATECGYLVAGEAVSMGETLYGVDFSFNSFANKEFDTFGTLQLVKRRVQDLVDFNTLISSSELATVRRAIKKIYNDVIVFIVDESENSVHENLLTLGIVQDVSTVLENPVQTTVSWSVVEVI